MKTIETKHDHINDVDIPIALKDLIIKLAKKFGVGLVNIESAQSDENGFEILVGGRGAERHILVTEEKNSFNYSVLVFDNRAVIERSAISVPPYIPANEAACVYNSCVDMLDEKTVKAFMSLLNHLGIMWLNTDEVVSVDDFVRTREMFMIVSSNERAEIHDDRPFGCREYNLAEINALLDELGAERDIRDIPFIKVKTADELLEFSDNLCVKDSPSGNFIMVEDGESIAYLKKRLKDGVLYRANPESWWYDAVSLFDENSNIHTTYFPFDGENPEFVSINGSFTREDLQALATKITERM